MKLDPRAEFRQHVWAYVLGLAVPLAAYGALAAMGAEGALAILFLSAYPALAVAIVTSGVGRRRSSARLMWLSVFLFCWVLTTFLINRSVIPR